MPKYCHVTNDAMDEFHRIWGFLDQPYPTVYPSLNSEHLTPRSVIAKELGLTSERVRQIENQALEKLYREAKRRLGHEVTDIDDLIAAFR